MTTYTPCLGGWCQRRDVCEHYVHGDRTLRPVENLCKRTHQIWFLMIRPQQEAKQHKEAA